MPISYFFKELDYKQTIDVLNFLATILILVIFWLIFG